MAYYLTSDEYLMHEGWTKPNHKYIHRYKKNGRWYYVYKNGKAYNWFQAITGAGERDAYNAAKKAYKNYQNNVNILAYKVSPTKNEIPEFYPSKVDGKKRLARKNKYKADVSKYKEAKAKYDEAFEDYRTTPLYKLSQVGRKVAKAKNYILKKMHVKSATTRTSSTR